MWGDFRPIVEKAEVLLAELAWLTQTGPELRIVHRFQELGTDCQAGEEIWAILVSHRGREAAFPLSLALRQVVTTWRKPSTSTERDSNCRGNAAVGILRETRHQFRHRIEEKNQPVRSKGIHKKNSQSI